jgi:hypothetical protein
MLLKVTLTPPSDVESGTVVAAELVEARFVPKMETNDPGATGCPVAKLAPFKTPPDATEGVDCAYAAKLREREAKKEIERVRMTLIVEDIRSQTDIPT